MAIGFKNMYGFVTVPTDFIANVGSNASTVMGDLKVPFALIAGAFLVFFIIGKIIGWFSGDSTHQLYDDDSDNEIF